MLCNLKISLKFLAVIYPIFFVLSYKISINKIILLDCHRFYVIMKTLTSIDIWKWVPVPVQILNWKSIHTIVVSMKEKYAWNKIFEYFKYLIYDPSKQGWTHLYSDAEEWYISCISKFQNFVNFSVRWTDHFFTLLFSVIGDFH